MRTRALAAVPVVLLLLTAACQGGNKPAATPEAAGKSGGSIVVAAEQFPKCLNPVQSCSNSSWLHWAVTGNVLPKAMQFDAKGNFVASPVLVEAPTIANGGLKENPFTITYKIDPKAVWDDGSPITSADFEFSWQAFLKTKGSLSTAGYDKIQKIDTTDPKTAVVTWTEPYADWGDILGGNQGFVLKKSAFPAGKVDLADAMVDNIPFSGSYWKLQSYSKQQLVLVRNDKFWGRKALLDQVTIVPREDSSTEVNSLLSGEVVAIYPQPNAEMPQRFKSSPNVSFVVDGGTTYEGLWMNTSKAPLNDKAVREAISWATDRDAVIGAIVKPINPQAKALNCAGWVPNVGKWCDETDFSSFKYDVDKAKTLLQGAGWTLGADGFFAKAGRRLTVEFSTTTGNKGREDTQALLKEKWKAAGIDLVVKNYASPSPIFTDILPKLSYMLAEFANVASPDPSVTTLYRCDQIPAKANDFSGQNYTAWCNKDADPLITESDRELDPAKRLELIKKIGDLAAKDIPWFPLYQKPLITAWRKDKIGGPIGVWTASSYSGLFNMHEWYLLK